MSSTERKTNKCQQAVPLHCRY